MLLTKPDVLRKKRNVLPTKRNVLLRLNIELWRRPSRGNVRSLLTSSIAENSFATQAFYDPDSVSTDLQAVFHLRNRSGELRSFFECRDEDAIAILASTKCKLSLGRPEAERVVFVHVRYAHRSWIPPRNRDCRLVPRLYCSPNGTALKLGEHVILLPFAYTLSDHPPLMRL